MPKSDDPLTAGHASGRRRRSELDALRGFAMLLGVLLHAALAYFPLSHWPVQDRGAAGSEDAWAAFVLVLHGFRMPLFFLMSGYFSAMLWRRRGLGSLVRHRLRRVAVPFAIGMVTIVPITDWATRPAGRADVERAVERAEGSEVFAAVLAGEVLAGDVTAVTRLLDDEARGVDVDARSEPGGWSALHYAAYAGRAEVAELLLERGADARPAASAYRGETPLMLAFYFGHERTADVLVAHGGGDPLLEGTEWSDLQGWGAGATGLPSWFDQMYHLWFLWVILFLIAGLAPVALVVDRLSGRTSGQRTPAGEAAWPRWAMWLLIPLTLLPQLLMADGGAHALFGPDTFTGLLPPLHVLAYYGTFLAFGALWYGRRDRHGTLLVDSLGRRWWLVLPVTFLVVLPVGLLAAYVPPYQSRLLSQAMQVIYPWGMSIGLIGLFRVLLARERRWVRYLSDASYWIYLAHVPLVIGAQKLLRGWALPTGVKFLVISAGVTLLLLASYQAFVRHTPIGALLSGSGGSRRRTLPAGPDGATAKS